MVYFYSCILVALGALFSVVGFQIVFRHSYSFINNFDKVKLRYKNPNGYAFRIGLIEFIGGIAQLTMGIISFLLLREKLSLTFLAAGVAFIFIGLMVNDNVGLK